MVKTMAKLRMAHASTHGARKPPGPKRAKVGDNNGQATHGARKTPRPKSGKGGVLIVALLGYEVYEDLPISRHYKT